MQIAILAEGDSLQLTEYEWFSKSDELQFIHLYFFIFCDKSGIIPLGQR